jgi:hypothetical protein
MTLVLLQILVTMFFKFSNFNGSANFVIHDCDQ